VTERSLEVGARSPGMPEERANGEEAGAEETRTPAVAEGKASKGTRLKEGRGKKPAVRTDFATRGGVYDARSGSAKVGEP
jgi:hypothetical protein